MFEKKYISLKEAAEISGYAPDYIGQLIRKGKLPGKQVFSHVSWITTREAVEAYVRSNTKSVEVSKFSGWREQVLASRLITKIFQVVTYIGIGAVVLLLLLLFYVLSVTIDHRINQRYLEKLEHVQE